MDGSGNVVARPFQKFFNYEELQPSDIPTDLPFEIFEKMDGSLGILYWIGDEPFIATRGSFSSDQAIHASSLVNKRFRELGISKRDLIPNATYLFEIIYPENRIVVDYGSDDTLFLLAILNQRKTFMFPSIGEGFDKIEILFGGVDKQYLAYGLEKMYGSMIGFEQDNPHHTKDLFGHVRDVVMSVGMGDLVSHLAAVFHDVGKLYTKRFKDAKGNPTEHAHYYSHENVSSYEAMFHMFNLGVSDDVIMDACLVIQNHMRLHGDVTPKTLEKLEKIVGKKNLERLKVLNLADTDGK